MFHNTSQHSQHSQTKPIKSKKNSNSESNVKDNSQDLNDISKRPLSPQQEKDIKKTSLGKRLLNLTHHIFNKKTIFELFLTGLFVYALAKKNLVDSSNPSQTQSDNLESSITQTATQYLGRPLNIKEKEGLKKMFTEENKKHVVHFLSSSQNIQTKPVQTKPVQTKPSTILHQNFRNLTTSNKSLGSQLKEKQEQAQAQTEAQTRAKKALIQKEYSPISIKLSPQRLQQIQPSSSPIIINQTQEKKQQMKRRENRQKSKERKERKERKEKKESKQEKTIVQRQKRLRSPQTQTQTQSESQSQKRLRLLSANTIKALKKSPPIKVLQGKKRELELQSPKTVSTATPTPIQIPKRIKSAPSVLKSHVSSSIHRSMKKSTSPSSPMLPLPPSSPSSPSSPMLPLPPLSVTQKPKQQTQQEQLPSYIELPLPPFSQQRQKQLDLLPLNTFKSSEKKGRPSTAKVQQQRLPSVRKKNTKALT